MRRTCLLGILAAAVLATSLARSNTDRPKEADLLDLYAGLKNKPFVDLTHAFAPGIPHWPAQP